MFPPRKRTATKQTRQAPLEHITAVWYVFTLCLSGVDTALCYLECNGPCSIWSVTEWNGPSSLVRRTQKGYKTHSPS